SHSLPTHTSPPPLHTLSLHDALPISTIDETFLDDTDSIVAQRVIGEHFPAGSATPIQIVVPEADAEAALQVVTSDPGVDSAFIRSEEHTSELQSRFDLVCRLLLEKKK